MVSFRNFGRMGNYLFECAAAYGYAKKHGVEFAVPTRTSNSFWNPIYLLHLANPKYIQGREDILFNENGHGYQEYPFKEEWRDLQVILNGYNQSYKYWDFCRDEMIKDFAFPYEFKKGIVSVHVRRGDYLIYPTKHPVVTEEYLRNAIHYFLEKDYHYFLFHSDDIVWCKWFVDKTYPDKDCFSFSEGHNEVEDLVSMSSCEHQICSNSTLAVWGAELNQNQNKIVVIPSEKNWFGYDNPHYVKDIYRPQWVQIEYKPIYEL